MYDSKPKNTNYNRRDFMKLVGGTAAVTAVGAIPGTTKADGLGDLVNGLGNAVGGTAAWVFKTGGDIVGGGLDIGGGVLKAGGDIINGGVAVIEGAGKAVLGAAGGLVNGAGKLLEDYVKDGWEYGAIDDYINKETIKKGDMKKILFGLSHYPADFVFDIGRAFHGVFVDIPKEAMNRAKEEKAAYIKKHGKEKVNYGPLAIVWNAKDGIVEFTNDCGRYVWKYGEVTVEGAAKQITKRPLETAAHGFWTWFFTYLSTQHGRSSGGGGGGEAPPPPNPWAP